MRKEWIESFVAVSQSKSLSKAARSQYISQPTLSNRISDLEDYLEVKLFTRSWNGVELTDEGMQFLPYAMKIIHTDNYFTFLLKSYKKQVKKVSHTPLTNKEEATFKIGISSYLASKHTNDIFGALESNFPTIKYDILTASSKELKELLHLGALDYIIYCGCKDTDYKTEFISHEEIVLIPSTYDYLFIKENVQQLQSINKPLLLNYNPIYENFLPHYKQSINLLNIRKIKVIDSFSLIKMLVKSGKGFCIAPNSSYETFFKDEGLHKINLPSNFSKLTFYSAYRESKQTFVVYSKYLNQLFKNKLYTYNE